MQSPRNLNKGKVEAKGGFKRVEEVEINLGLSASEEPDIHRKMPGLGVAMK